MDGSERIRLREVEEDDHRLIELWDEDPELNLLMGNENSGGLLFDIDDIPSRTSLRRMIETRCGQVIGNVDLLHIDRRRKEAEMVIRIGRKDCWSRGYGGEAVRLLLDLAFEELGLESVYLRVCRFNHRAVNCYRRAGFVKVGIVRRRRSKGDMEILLMRATERSFQKTDTTA